MESKHKLPPSPKIKVNIKVTQANNKNKKKSINITKHFQNDQKERTKDNLEN